MQFGGAPEAVVAGDSSGYVLSRYKENSGRNYINSTASRVDRAIMNDKKAKFEKMMKAVGVELKSDEKDA
ncbi:hypothetical protein PF004_g7178 [Phytophthora fragariae]|uniref:Uncharacterized protein n=1 Tax=Phytophthora fragariae TaxID=53985 RepID=A0A6G0PAX5_9STRA|nr:hypothetical protein PF004_g7178 [Phytophthora fragariae]